MMGRLTEFQQRLAAIVEKAAEKTKRHECIWTPAEKTVDSGFDTDLGSLTLQIRFICSSSDSDSVIAVLVDGDSTIVSLEVFDGQQHYDTFLNCFELARAQATGSIYKLEELESELGLERPKF